MNMAHGARSASRNAGFTFVELMVVLTIMATLAMISVPMLTVAAQREKERELASALAEMRQAIDAYKRASDEGRVSSSGAGSGYPGTLGELVAGVPDQKNPARATLYFLRRIPRDPFYPDAQVPAEDTWLKRSYSSPPEAPQEGEDVFDVLSKSDRVGLNGIPLREW
jgi:general secretion pathway protein G